ASELGVAVRPTSGPVLERPGDLAALLTNLEQGQVFFIDEIHRLSHVVEETLYPAMEDFQLDLVVGRSEEHTSELQSRENLVCRRPHLPALPTRRSSDLRLRAGRRRAADVGPGARAAGRPRRAADEPRAGAGVLHRRDPPPEPRRRGDALPGDGGLPAGPRRG